MSYSGNKEDFFILLRYRNGAFSASLKRGNSNWSQCNSDQILSVFEDIYQFMRSTKQSTSIAGIEVVKRKSYNGLDTFFIDFGLYSINVMIPKDTSKDSVIVRATLPFCSSQPTANMEDYYEEEFA